jgi:LPS sulfotransferase NodH
MGKGKKFAIITTPRSGSTWLINLLDQMEGVNAYGELFLPRKRKPEAAARSGSFAYPRFVETGSHKLPARPAAVFAYLNRLYGQPGTNGFKLMYAHLGRFPELLAYFIARRVHVIHLVRENTLDVVVSQAINRKSAQAHKLAREQAGGNGSEAVEVELNPRRLLAKIEHKQRKTQKMRRLLRTAGLPQREIAYEQLQRDPVAFGALCQFLAIPFSGELPESQFVRSRQRSHAEVIRNYSDVKQALAGTPYLGWLED